jgi:hypothetical protein
MVEFTATPSSAGFGEPSCLPNLCEQTVAKRAENYGHHAPERVVSRGVSRVPRAWCGDRDLVRARDHVEWRSSAPRSRS